MASERDIDVRFKVAADEDRISKMAVEKEIDGCSKLAVEKEIDGSSKMAVEKEIDGSSKMAVEKEIDGRSKMAAERDIYERPKIATEKDLEGRSKTEREIDGRFKMAAERHKEGKPNMSPEREKDGRSKMAAERDIDGGWAWVVLGLSTICRIIEANIVLSVGIFQVQFLEHFTSGISLTSLLSSVFMCLQLSVGPFSSLLCNLFSVRVALMVGGVLFSLGFISASFASTMPQLFITFSVIGGFGFGIVYTPLNVVIGHYFSRLRSVANGVSTSAAGLGFAVGPYLNVWLIENYGWRFTLAIMAGLVLQFCVLAAASFPTRSEVNSPKRNQSSESSVKGRQRSTHFSKFWYLVHPHWWMFCSNYGFQMMAWAIQVVHFPSFAESRGFSLEELNSLFVAFGIAVAVARMLCGFLCNDDSVDPLMVLIGIQGLQAVVTILMPFYAHSFSGLLVYQALVAVFLGAAFVPITPLAVRLFGVHRLATVFGSVMMWGGVGSLIGPVVAGYLYDLSQSYAFGFHISGLFVFAGSFILLLIPVVKVKAENSVMDNAETLHHENLTLIVQEKS